MFFFFSVFVKCPVLTLVPNIAFDEGDNDNGLGKIRARWKHLELFTDERRLIASCNVRQRCDSVCGVARPPDRPPARPIDRSSSTCTAYMPAENVWMMYTFGVRRHSQARIQRSHEKLCVPIRARAPTERDNVNKYFIACTWEFDWVYKAKRIHDGVWIVWCMWERMSYGSQLLLRPTKIYEALNA